MKDWQKSKTIWVNLLSLILGIIPLIDSDILAIFGVKNVIQYLAVLGFLNQILNILLRFVTKEPIKAINLRRPTK